MTLDFTDVCVWNMSPDCCCPRS